MRTFARMLIPPLALAAFLDGASPAGAGTAVEGMTATVIQQNQSAFEQVLSDDLMLPQFAESLAKKILVTFFPGSEHHKLEPPLH